MATLGAPHPVQEVVQVVVHLLLGLPPMEDRPPPPQQQLSSSVKGIHEDWLDFSMPVTGGVSEVSDKHFVTALLIFNE